MPRSLVEPQRPQVVVRGDQPHAGQAHRHGGGRRRREQRRAAPAAAGHGRDQADDLQAVLVRVVGQRAGHRPGVVDRHQGRQGTQVVAGRHGLGPPTRARAARRPPSARRVGSPVPRTHPRPGLRSSPSPPCRPGSYLRRVVQRWVADTGHAVTDRPLPSPEAVGQTALVTIRSLPAVGALLVAVALTAGCGSDDDSRSSAAPSASSEVTPTGVRARRRPPPRARWSPRCHLPPGAGSDPAPAGQPATGGAAKTAGQCARCEAGRRRLPGRWPEGAAPEGPFRRLWPGRPRSGLLRADRHRRGHGLRVPGRHQCQ